MSRIALTGALALMLLSTGAMAQDYEGYMNHLRRDCDHGDRRACIRMGIEIGAHRERWDEWHHRHPDFVFEVP